MMKKHVLFLTLCLLFAVSSCTVEDPAEIVIREQESASNRSTSDVHEVYFGGILTQIINSVEFHDPEIGARLRSKIRGVRTHFLDDGSIAWVYHYEIPHYVHINVNGVMPQMPRAGQVMIMLHEVFHVYLFLEGNPNDSPAISHAKMIKNPIYVKWIRTAMMGSGIVLSEKDAEILTYFGTNFKPVDDAERQIYDLLCERLGL